MANEGLTRRAALALGATAALAAGGGATVAAAAQSGHPKLGIAAPTFRRFPLGGFEVTVIRDGAVRGAGPHPTFGENQSAEAVAELLRENFLPADAGESVFNVTVVNTGERLVMFDAGNGAGRRPDAGLLRARLEEAGLSPDRIDMVVITHMHPDHVGGLVEDGAPAFPNATYVTGRAEFDFFTSDRAPERIVPLVASNVRPLADRMRFVEPGEQAAPGIEAVEAFGHTPGHMAWHVESEGRRLLVTADTANHFVLSMQRPDWHVRFDMDKDAAAATRRRLLGMLAADRIPFVGYHMPGSGVGFVEAAGDGFRFVPETYQLNV
jgi:glyoxylase-like metal-dependent hydrolase (beta-lactamase superfamily II)